jgi:hypothetical protein
VGPQPSVSPSSPHAHVLVGVAVARKERLRILGVTPRTSRSARAAAEPAAVPDTHVLARPAAPPAGAWRTARVFISSTFADMHSERDALVQTVFPLLREVPAGTLTRARTQDADA